MMRKVNTDRLDALSFLNGLVFYAPVALLVRTDAGVTTAQFFILQAVLSLTVFLFEIPTGMITDRIGYKNTLIFAQTALFLARILLFLAFVRRSWLLFAAEAVVEGLAACFLSGTQEAYVYSVYAEERCPVKMAHVSNCGTAGFLVSTLLWAAFYRAGGIGALLLATAAASGAAIPCAAGIRREPDSGPAIFQGAETRGGGVTAVFADGYMARMVLLASGFSLASLLINFFYVDKLLACGLREELMSPVIIAYSVIQMLAEKLLDRIGGARRRGAMMAAILVSGAMMTVLALSRVAAVVVPVMVVLPLALSVPEFILDSMKNAYIDQTGQSKKRATILSAANMACNLVEIVFLSASAYVAGIGVSACFAGAGILLVLLGAGVCIGAHGRG